MSDEKDSFSPRLAPLIETLGNGLEVLVLEDGSAPVASVQLWCRTGSIHEGRWMGAGLSHFVEHMLFKGTSKRGLGEIARGVQEQGGYINAYTSFDRTVYWIDTPAAGVGEAVDILIDAASDSLMPSGEVAKEQEVIRREFAMGNDDPGRVLSKASFANAFRSHPYRHPVIGHQEVFDQLGRDDLLSYYRARYVPNNCFLVVVGAVGAEEVLAAAEESCGGWGRAALAPVTIPEEPPQLGRRDRHEEFSTPLHHLSLTWQTPELWHPDVPALDVLATVLGEGRSSRLYQGVREGRRLAHSIYAYAYTPGAKGLFMVGAEADPQHREKLEGAILEEVARLKEEPVGGGELEKARKVALCDLHHSMTKMRGRASDLAGSWMLTGNPGFSKEYVEGLAHVTAGDVQRVAQKYLGEGTLSSTSLSPVGSLPKRAAGKAGAGAPEAALTELGNGLRVVVKQDRRVPLAYAYLSFGGGLLADGYARAGRGQLMASTLLKGTSARSAAEIADAIEGVGGSIDASGGNNSFGLSADLLAEDLPMALGVMGDVVADASFPEEEVAAEKEALIARIRSDLEDPLNAAFKEARAQVFGALPFGRPLTGDEELVAGFGAEDLRALRGQILQGANGVLTVVGDVDPDQVLADVEKAFGGLMTGSAFLDALDLPGPQPKGGVVSLEKDKEQAALVLAYPGVDIRSPDRYALDLVDAACSDMASRLFNRIREELGLCYYIGAGQLHGYTQGMFSFYVGTSAEKLDLVQEELLDEAKKLAEEGITEEELERARTSMLGRREIGLQSPGSLGQAMALDTLYGFGHGHYREVPELIGAVTLEDVREVCGKVFGGGEASIVRVLPTS